MSEVNKPENENTDPKCPFDPDQYQAKVNNVAPVGSFPWAMIQFYLNKFVRRSIWPVGLRITILGNPPTLQMDQFGNNRWVPWQPEQEDMMACDWEFEGSVCREDSMLIFDLKLGFEQTPAGSKWWGYNNWGNESTHTGTLNITQNNIGIVDIQRFYLDIDNTVPTILTIDLLVSTDNDSDQKVHQLLEKIFYVTVDNETYNLGTRSGWEQNGLYTYSVNYTYDDSRYDTDNYQKIDVKKLSEILKQSGETKRFCLNWFDH
ncbi:Thoeris anti-defense Tad2 family protein [Xenorhabdus bovienii]|uniref:Thoeris anti-defense Tad2 family protein n=1 Tax=Xenorhabdus bovienii TaxID=40576 RepID=UPI00237C743B|nr:hypothetical protein [Xenorhabdus bovienii]MDE1474095.1 DUF2829 domain-containing protein [Xenorhabdus bovienii]MDE9457512.1 DUF2829 domain-containing protein [Xenorhabdus bovienii]MDE9487642.1 DUF2829 domain-containing protein [Xenorhabdus bovienii]MDE9514390.1 DUF2829 domain-containing protein [Xenorhabdus bovienii]